METKQNWKIVTKEKTWPVHCGIENTHLNLYWDFFNSVFKIIFYYVTEDCSNSLRQGSLWEYNCLRMLGFVSFDFFFAIGEWGGWKGGGEENYTPPPQKKNIYCEIIIVKKVHRNQAFTVRSYELLKVVSCKEFSVDAVWSLLYVVHLDSLSIVFTGYYCLPKYCICA